MALDLSDLQSVIKSDLSGGGEQRGSFGREAESAARNYAAGFADIAGALGSDAAAEWAERQRAVADIVGSRSALPQSYKDVDGVRSALGYLAHLGVQTVPYAAEMALGAATLGGSEAALMAGRAAATTVGRSAARMGAEDLLARAAASGRVITPATEAAAARLAEREVAKGYARTAGGVAASYPSGVGQILGAQKEEGGEYNAPAAFALGAPYALANAVGIEGAIARGIPKEAMASVLKRVPLSAGKVGLSEGVSETFQQGMEEIGRASVNPDYDPTSEAALRRYTESFIGGAALGGVMGGAGGLRKRNAYERPVAPVDDHKPTDILTQPAGTQGELFTEDQAPLNQFSSLRPAPAAPDIDLEGLNRQRQAIVRTMNEYAQQGDQQNFYKMQDALGRIDAELGGYAQQAELLNRQRAAQMEGQRQLPLAYPAPELPAAQGELFAGAPRRAAPAPEARTDQGGQQVTDLGQGPDLFSSKPTTTFGTDFSPRLIRMRLQAANAHDGGLARADAFTHRMAHNLTVALHENDAAVSDLIAREQAALEGSPLKPSTIEKRQKILDTAAQIVAEYRQRRTSAYAEEARIRQEQGAAPGAVVGASAPGDVTEQGMRERNAAQQAQEQQAQLEAGLADADRRTADSMKQRGAQQRLAILSDVLADPDTKNPVGRFTATLKKLGYKTPTLNAEEVAMIERFEQTREAYTQPNTQQEFNLKGGEGVAPAAKPTAEPAPTETAAPKGQYSLFDKNGKPTNRAKGKATDQVVDRAVKDAEQTLAKSKKGKRVKLQEIAAEPEAATTDEQAPAEKEVSESDLNRWKDLVFTAYQKGAIELEDVGRLSEKLDEGTKDALAEVQAEMAGVARRSRPDTTKGRASKAETEAANRQLNADLQEGLASEAGLSADTQKVTPADQRIYDMIDEGASTKDILTAIADDTSLPPGYRAVAKILARFKVPTTVKIANLEGKRGEENYIGLYQPQSDTILIDERKGSAPHAFMHEFVHALTVAAIRSNTSAGRKIVAIYNKYIKAAGTKLSGEYGIKNAEEFASEVLANPAFAQQLRNIKTEGMVGRLWNRFVDAVREVAGLQRIDRDIVNQILAATEEAQAARAGDLASIQATANTEAAPYATIIQGKDNLINQAKANIDKLPTWARGPVRGIHNALFGSKSTTLGVMITEDIAELAKKHMPSVEKFVEVQHQRNSLTAAMERRLTTIKTNFESLDSKTRRAVNKLIATMTVEGEWGFVPAYLKEAPEVNAELAKQFNALPKDAKQVVQDVFQHGHESLRDKQQAVKDKLNEVVDEAARKTLEQQFATILKINPNTPYAPLKRFGQFVIVAKSAAWKAAEASGDTKAMKEMESDEAHRVVEFAETAGEAEEIYDQLKTTGIYADVEPPFRKSAAHDSLYRGTDLYKGFAKLKRLIAAEKGVEEDGNKLLGELESMVNQLYLLSLAESSARKSEMQRKKTAGFNRDMMRAFFTQGMADAHYIANLKTADASMDAMIEMQKEAAADRKSAYPYLNELMAREAMSLEVRPPTMLDGANRMVADWFLTFSPAFYFQQLTQTYVLSLPWLAGKYDYFKSEAALRKAYKDIFPLIKETGLKEHMDFSKAPEDVREMLKVLVGRGRIDIGVEAELGGFRSEGGNKFVDAYITSTNRMRGAINRIEALNRSTAAIAAYRLEMAKSGNKDAAINAADKVVHVTHGSYDGFNTPRLFKMNALTRSATQFRRFQIIQLSMLGRMVKSAFAGASAEEKAIGRKQLTFLVLHSGVLGGAKGLPVYVPAAMLYSILSSAFGDDDDPKDFEAWLRDKGGVLLARGVPANLGVDLSGKLGMGNVMSLLPYTDIDLTTRSGYEKTVTAFTGPFLSGLLPKMIDGTQLVAKGDYYKGLEQMLPNGLSNGMKGLRFVGDGVTQRNGDRLMGADEISFADGVMQALGLPTTTMTERQYRQDRVKKTDKFYSDRSKELKREYVEAVRDKDTATIAEVRREWNTLQESRVRNGYTTEPVSQLLKAPLEHAKQERDVVGGVPTRKYNRKFVESLTQD